MTFLRPLWLLCVALGFLLPTASAQQEAAAKLYTRAENGTVRAAVQIRISAGWHLYHTDLGHPEAVGKPLDFEFGGEGIEWSETRVSEPESYAEDIDEGIFVNVHHLKAFVYAVGTLEEGADPEDATVSLTGLTCQTDGLCIPYEEEIESEGEGRDKVWEDFPEGLTAAEKESIPATRLQPGKPGFGAIDTSSPQGLGFDSGDDQKVEGELFVREVEGELRAVVRVQIDDTWHIYHGPTEADLGDRKPIAEPTVVTFGGADFEPAIFPEPHAYPGGLSEIDFQETPVNVHDGEVLFLGRAEGGDPDDVTAVVVGQACDPNTCLPFELELASLGAGPDELFVGFDSGPVVSAGSGSTPADEGQEEDGGLGGLILKAILGGLITLLMPCTYPMIPITISFFTKQAIARNGNVLPLSLAYGAGIVVIFMLIGAVVGPVILTFATHPVTNLVIGGMFLFFAFVLFGAVNLQPPAFLMSAAGKASSKGGLFGVFLMGATLVVTSFTCTAPIMGSLLTSSATEGTGLLHIVIGMGVFGATMAVPFVALSLVPGRMQKMPQAGEWMHVLKVFLGFVELAASLKFFSNSDVIWKWGLISRELFLVAWVGIFIAAALFLWGMIRLEGETAERIGAWRLTGGLSSLLFSLYCGMGVIGYQLDDIMTAIIPPYSTERLAGYGEGESAPKSHAIVEDDLELAKAAAIEQDKLVLVNFTGHT